MKKLTFTFLTVFICQLLIAQKSLFFLNIKTNNTIEVYEGQTLSVQYKGYNQQLFFAKNVVTEITDSTIALGNINNTILPIWAQKLTKRYEPNYRIIYIKDLVSFRRLTGGRIITKNLISTGIALGTIYGYISLFQNANFSVTQNILLSLGISSFTAILNAFILPDNPKYKIENNWIVSVRN